MLPSSTYDVNKLRRTARYTLLLWELEGERSNKLKDYFVHSRTNAFLKLELGHRYGVTTQEQIDILIKQALLFGKDCLGDVIADVLYMRDAAKYLASMAYYFCTPGVMANDDYLREHDFRLTILSRVIYDVSDEMKAQSRRDAVISMLNILPLGYSQHRGVLGFFDQHVEDRPVTKTN